MEGKLARRRCDDEQNTRTRATVRHAVPPPLAETVRCAIGGRRDVAIKTMQHAWPPAWNRETKPPLFRHAAGEMNFADLCPWLHPQTALTNGGYFSCLPGVGEPFN